MIQPQPTDDRRTPTLSWVGLIAVVMAAAGVRLIVSGFSMVVGADGPTFLHLAGLFARGEFAEGIRHDYHPLYPMLVGAALRIGWDPEFAGMAVSFLFGALTPVPLFLLARRTLGDATALAGGLLLAIHPVAARLSVDQKSDSTYTFLFALAILLAWEGIRTRRIGTLFLGGLSTGAAYLVRPEGLTVVVIALPWILFSKSDSARRRFTLAGALLLGTAILVGPYSAAISAQDGVFQITRKKGLSDLLGAVPLAESEREARTGRANTPGGSEGEVPTLRLGLLVPIQGKGTPKQMLRDGKGEIGLPKRMTLATAAVAVEFVETLHPVLSVLLILGISSMGALPRPRDQERFLGALLLLYLVILFLLVFGVGYLSRRHIFPVCMVALPWSAAGIRECSRWLSPRLARWSMTAPVADGRHASALILAAVALVMAPKTFYPHRLDQLNLREAGIWIRSLSQGNPAPVLTHLEKVAFYAGAERIPFHADYSTSLHVARQSGARFAALYKEKVNAVSPGFFESIKDADLIHRVFFRHYERGEMRDLHIFEITYPSPKDDAGGR